LRQKGGFVQRVPVEILGLVKLFLKENEFKLRMVENSSGAFPVNNILKHGDALSSLLFKFALGSASGRSKKTRKE
jgi:hypothetical protein